MNDNTVISNINGQGLAEEGAGMGAGLNGGGFFELPGCVTTFAFAGGQCGKGGAHGEGGNYGSQFVTGSGRGISNVTIQNVRLNDLVDGSASWGAFWSAMAPDGSAHRNITFRKVVAMRTDRDGINVHGNVIGWLGEDLHFENQGDDVYAVWGAGGGYDVQFHGLGNPNDVACGLSNPPATDIVFRRLFAGPGSSPWSSCSHIFGSGRVEIHDLKCCSTKSNHPVLIVDSTFCPSYKQANVTVTGLQWYGDYGQDLCKDKGKTRVSAPWQGSAGWKQEFLNVQGLDC